jgi:hypothetical protein
VDIQKLDGVRRYAFDYIVGLLWLVALGFAFKTENGIVCLAKFVSDVGAASDIKHIPEQAWMFALIVAGVVVPYCMSLVVSPVAFAFSNVVLRFGLKAEQHSRLDDGETIFAVAEQIIQSTVEATFGHTDGTMLLYVEAVAPRLATGIRRSYDEFSFRIGTIIPVVALIVMAVYRVISVHWVGALLAAVVGVAVLVSGAVQIYQLLMQCRTRLYLAIVLAKKYAAVVAAPSSESEG